MISIYLGQDLFFRELLYRDNWAEDLLLAELHLRGDSCQDGWPGKHKKLTRKFGRVFVISNALDLSLSNVQLRRMVTGQEIVSGSLLLCPCKMSQVDDVYVSLEVEVSH